MTTGERIKAARKRAGMTQQDLADRLQISYVGVSQWESGRRNPQKGTLERIAAVLDVPLSSLTGTYIMNDDEIFDFVTRAWAHVDYQVTMLQKGGPQEEIERWERVCSELRKLNEDILAQNQEEREKLPEQEEELLELFRQLNSEGQRRIIAIACDYAKIFEYQQQGEKE